MVAMKLRNSGPSNRQITDLIEMDDDQKTPIQLSNIGTRLEPSMTWKIYVAAGAISAWPAYQDVVRFGFGRETAIGFIESTAVGCVLWGFVGNWLYRSWKRRIKA